MLHKLAQRKHTAPALAQIRKKRGLQAQLARHLGITRQAIWHWHHVPIGYLKRVEKFTGIPREKLRPDIFR